MLQPFFEWLGGLPVSLAIGASIWIYPLIQAIHLVFLTLLMGSILIVDLRLLGLGISSQPVSKVARDARPWLITGLIGMLLTGAPQLMQNSMREYFSEFFWYKMYLIAFGLILMVTVRRKATQASESTVLGKLVGLVSIAVWIGVVISARLIGLFTCAARREACPQPRVSGTLPMPAASRKPPRTTADAAETVIMVQTSHQPAIVPRSFASAIGVTRLSPSMMLTAAMHSTMIPRTIQTFRFMRTIPPSRPA
jgi:hypothetical protein